MGLPEKRSIIRHLQDAIMGNLPDIAFSSPYSLPEDFTPIGIVPEHIRDIFSRAHWFINKNAQLRVKFFEEINDEGSDLLNLTGTFEVCEHNIICGSTLGNIANFGILCHVEKAREYFRPPAVFDGWIVAVPPEENFNFGKMCLESDHLVIKSYKLLLDILSGKCFFDGDNGLNEISYNEVQIGEVNDEVLRQIIYLRKTILIALDRFDPYQDISSEIYAFRNRSALDYAVYRSARSIFHRIIIILDTILQSSILDMIDVTQIRTLEQRALSIEMRSNWELVIQRPIS